MWTNREQSPASFSTHFIIIKSPSLLSGHPMILKIVGKFQEWYLFGDCACFSKFKSIIPEHLDVRAKVAELACFLLLFYFFPVGLALKTFCCLLIPLQP